MSDCIINRLNQEFSDEDAQKVVTATLKSARGYKPLDTKESNKGEKTMLRGQINHLYYKTKNFAFEITGKWNYLV